MKFFFIYFVLIIVTLFTASCVSTPALPNIDFRQEMRDFVIKIANTAHLSNPDFIIVPQNGQELITNTGEADGTLQTNYIQAIDGTGREDLFYGYTGDNIATPQQENLYMAGLLDKFEENGIEVLSTDYCSTTDNINDSYNKNFIKHYISFAATQRTLDVIPGSPAPYNENTGSVTTLNNAQNFLYLINPEGFGSKTNFLAAVDATNFDIIIMDCFYNGQEYQASEISDLKTKPGGGTRLVIAYMSIGEAEDYRFYWNTSWKTGNPFWLEKENPNWEGNYKVRYWEKDWQNIILSGNSSYLGKILSAGFDGVYLDIIDGFEYFEEY